MSIDELVMEGDTVVFDEDTRLWSETNTRLYLADLAQDHRRRHHDELGDSW